MSGTVYHFSREGLQALVDLLRAGGRRVLAPVERDGTVLFDEIRSVAEMPVGRRDSQTAGSWRIGPGRAGEVFGVVHGPNSLKGFFFPAHESLFAFRRSADGIEVEATPPPDEAVAVLGVRACDVAAAAVQDRVFLNDRFPDGHYARRRADAVVVAVACTRAVSTCFCTSLGSGPRPGEDGFDIALTELDDGFVARAGSERGAALLAALPARPATTAESEAADAAVERCAASIERRLDTHDLARLLPARAEHPHWDDVAARCLSCGNCTMVCPTCFCHTVTDVTDLAGEDGVRARAWESCFSPEHGQIHGKNFRPTTRERYRQWLTHKLATWHEQFGQSGCVGCGRCLSWCPVGIDLTQEVAALRRDPEPAA